MRRSLSRSDYLSILYGLGDNRLSSQIADTMRFLAYQLEFKVSLTRSQRQRIVVELSALTQSTAWRSYDVKLWYYIATAQLADPRLAPILLKQAKAESDTHLAVWGLLAAATSAGNKGIAFDENVSARSLSKLSTEAFKIGSERCRVFAAMHEMLVTGRTNASPFISHLEKLSSTDLEFCLLAFGRGQLDFADGQERKYVADFVTMDGIDHPSPTVSEYSLWCARIRKLDIPQYSRLLEGHLHGDSPSVRSSIYRYLGSRSQRLRRTSWPLLNERQKAESADCRFEIFSALSTRIGTYDSIGRTNSQYEIKAFIDWHSRELDERCAKRQFSFLLHNVKNSTAQDYLIEEILAANDDRMRVYIPQLRNTKRLPSRFTKTLHQAGVITRSVQPDLFNSGALSEQSTHVVHHSAPGADAQLTDYRSNNARTSIGGRVLSDLETVILATANRREARAVITELRQRSERLGFPIHSQTDNILPFNEGRLQRKNGTFRVLAVRADDTGPLEATDLLRRILDHHRAKFIFFVGCAALLDEKQSAAPGTVFIARRAIDVDKREESVDGTWYDMDQAPGDARILRNVDSLIDAGHFDHMNVVTNRHFLSGSAFEGNRKSKARKAFVKQFPKDAVILEMESYAVLDAVKRRRQEGQDLSVSVIKGVSDFGDENAQIDKDGPQILATQNAMRVACTLLEHM